MRRYPPIVVSLAVGILLLVASCYSIAKGNAVGVQNIDGQILTETTTPDEAQVQTVDAELQEEAADEEAESTYESLVGSRDWRDDESEMLLQIAMAEAEGESVEGKALVMMVVLNRVWSEEFPDTIEEVIFQRNQFSVVAPGGRYYTTEPDEGCYEALELVENGWDESQGALYFESCNGSSWQSRNLEYLFQEGNHRFYR